MGSLCYTPSSFSILTDMADIADMADLTIMQFNIYGIPVLYTKFFLYPNGYGGYGVYGGFDNKLIQSPLSGVFHRCNIDYSLNFSLMLSLCAVNDPTPRFCDVFFTSS